MLQRLLMLADVNVPDSAGLTPLELVLSGLSCKNQDQVESTVDALLKEGATVSKKSQELAFVKTLYWNDYYNEKTILPNIICSLLNYRVDPNLRLFTDESDRVGIPVLALASCFEDYAVTRCLINFSAGMEENFGNFDIFFEKCKKIIARGKE